MRLMRNLRCTVLLQFGCRIIHSILIATAIKMGLRPEVNRNLNPFERPQLKNLRGPEFVGLSPLPKGLCLSHSISANNTRLVRHTRAICQALDSGRNPKNFWLPTAKRAS
jgi:hypothetical protein